MINIKHKILPNKKKSFQTLILYKRLDKKIKSILSS